MSVVAPNQTYKRQQETLVPATFKKAVISAINVQAFTADVYFSQNPSNVIRSIPLASHIDATAIMVGDRCRVDVFDETNQRDMVVAYVYGRKF